MMDMENYCYLYRKICIFFSLHFFFFRIPQAVKKFEQTEAFLKSLLRAPMGILEECSISRTGYNFRPIFGTGRLGLNRWNCKFYSTNTLNSRLICTRDFSSLKNTPNNNFLRHKVFGWTHERSRRQFLKRSFMTKCKLPLSNKPTSTMTVCYSSSLSSYLSTLKLYPVIKKYFLPPLSCHHESVSLRSVLYPKPIEKASFSKTCHQKGLQSLEHPGSLRSSGPSSKYLKCLEYLSKRKLLSPKVCKQYSSRPMFYSSCPHLPSQDVSKSDQKAPKRLPKSQRNKKQTPKSVYRGPCYPIFLHRVHWRGFHSSLLSFAKSDFNKPPTCEKMEKICKPTEVKKADKYGQPCQEKSDVCRQEKVKCDGSQRNKERTRQKPKTEKKIMDPACRQTCLPIGKCELPRTLPPPKMEYAKVTCPPPKFVKPNSCPVLEHFQKDDQSHVGIKERMNARKKQICAPLPLPKPPYAPIVLCPCPPPRKVHPGPCPCYETKEIPKRPSIQPCRLKKEYPCPTGVYYCPSQKKPCNLKKEETGCEHRKKKEAPAS